MEKELLSQNSLAFDLSKVHEKLQNIKTLSDLTGPGGAMQELMKQAVERILKAEEEDHLGYESYQKSSLKQTNSSNGYSKKTVKTSSGPMELNIPRDREGTLEPKLVEKDQKFDRDFEKKIIGMYSRGMSTRDIQSQLEEFYCTEVSPTLISCITDKVLEGVKEWQAGPLDDVYPTLFMDAIHYKIRKEAKVISNAAYTCMGISLEATVEVLDLWLADTEGSRFWLSVMTELKARGIKDVLIACLKGFPEAIASAFPKTQVQLCIVHQIRNSFRYVGAKYHRAFIADLKQVHRAPSLEVAEMELDQLETKWKERYPQAVAGWRNNWQNLSTYFSYPAEIRRTIYTTNAVEALHRQFRKVTKKKPLFLLTRLSRKCCT